MNRRIAILGIIVAGLVLARYIMGGGFRGMINLGEKKSYVCEKEVKSILIQGTTGEIIVQKGDVDRATVVYSEREDDPVYQISESAGELTVVQDRKFRLFHIDLFRYSLTVTVPGDLKGELHITNKSGNIKVSNLSGKTVFIDNLTGSITFEQVASKGDLTVNNTTGTVALANVAAAGDVDIKNTTGKIQVDNLKSGGSIRMKTITGSVTGTIAGKESDYRISSKVVTGSNGLSNTGHGNRKLDVHTTTGSIGLSFTE